MGDIDAFDHHRKYLSYQMTRPDYAKAMPTITNLAIEHTKGMTDIVLSDFCCGVGNSTRTFTKLVKVKKAFLIDLNFGFLERAESTITDVKDVILKNKDILELEFKKNSDIIFSIFAYHHIEDKEKAKYISQIKKALKNGGVLIFGEIYFNDKAQEQKYYDELYKAIPAFKKSPELQKFINQTANSKKCEFKVSKKFTEDLFKKNGFKKIDEQKIWPQDSNDEGMFIQVYTLS